MTDKTPPKVKIEWEPITEGIELILQRHDADPAIFALNLFDVKELLHDITEARMLSRGYEKVECEVGGVEDKWIIFVMGNEFRVASTFIEARSKYEGVWCCLQDDEGREIVWPCTDLVTAWRAVE